LNILREILNYKEELNGAVFEVIRAVSMKRRIIRDVTSSSPMEVHRRFGRTYFSSMVQEYANKQEFCLLHVSCCSFGLLFDLNN
jgi:hypothetical protein